MLILNRRTDESIMIGDDIKITILGSRGDGIRVGIQAPREIEVHRLEVYERMQAEKANGQ